MRLPVALQSRRALTECSSLMSVDPISTGRSREVPCVSKALITRSLGSLFSYLGLRSRAETRGIGDSASTSSLSIVLGSSIVNTVNLFTSDQGTLIAGCATQNPFPLGGKTLLSELHLSTPTDLQSTPSAALWWVDRCPCGGDNPRLHGSRLHIGSILAVTPQANFLWKITFDMLYTNEFVIRVHSRALSIPSEHNTIWWGHWASNNQTRAHVETSGSKQDELASDLGRKS